MEHEMIRDDELQHYGVLGMKWGVRRGNYSKSYSKGVKKLKKYAKKAEKYKTESDRLAYKSARLYAKGRDDDKAKKLDAKSRQKNYTATKYTNAGRKFYKKMEKTFAEVDVKELNPEDVEYGKKYAALILS